MNHLLAKVNDRRNKYRKMMSDVVVFQKPETLDNCIGYEPSNVLEDDQWFFIEQFSNQDYCIDLLKDQCFNSTDYADLNKVEPEKISYLVAYQNENEYYFQRVYPTNMFRDKRFVLIGDEIEIKEEKHGVMLNDIPDAIYIKNEDRLYFRKLEIISPIFRGIDVLYREATEEETEAFLSEEFIDLWEGYSAEDVKKANRKRIAMAINTLRNFKPKQKKEIFQYTREYFPDLEYDGKSFKIKGEEDLKNLLFGIEQRLYTTPVTKEKRCASAVFTLQ